MSISWAFTQWHATDRVARVATTIEAKNWKLCPADVTNLSLVVVPVLSPSSASVPAKNQRRYTVHSGADRQGKRTT